MIYRGKFTKTGLMKYIGHLDLMHLWERALRRGQIELAYSEGFHPSPKLSLANPLSLGIESVAEYIQFETSSVQEEEGIFQKLNQMLPEGISLLYLAASPDTKKIFSSIEWSEYEFIFDEDKNAEELRDRIEFIDESPEILVKKRKKVKRKSEKIFVEKDVKSFIDKIELHCEPELKVTARLMSQDGQHLGAREFLKILLVGDEKTDPDGVRILRKAQYVSKQNFDQVILK